MTPIRTLTAGMLLCGLALAPGQARAYSALYSFGDSLSDAGNVYLFTGLTQPAAPYYQGEYSNGPNWIQDVSLALGLGPAIPSVVGGNDYAWGGATTGNSLTATSGSPIPTVTQQVNQFLSVQGGVAPSTGLYTVWAGANDLFNMLEGGLPEADASAAAGTEAAAIAFLASKGAQDFLVPLVPDLGVTPLAGLLGAQATAKTFSGDYNAALEADLASLAATPGIELKFVDTFGLLDSVVANPAAYGFSDATHSCYVGPYTGGGTECATPNQYVFWDRLHPTAAADVIIAQEALPEPAPLALLAMGLLGLVWVRGRAQKAA